MSCQQTLLPDAEVIAEILDRPVSFADAAEQAACEHILAKLTTKELESAARTSYAYWLAATTTAATSSHDAYDTTVRPPALEEARERMALREVRRHLVGANNDTTVAIKTLQHALAYRLDKKVDVLRTCFATSLENIGMVPHQHEQQLSREDHEIRGSYGAQIKIELSKQTMVVCGHDRYDRAILIKMGRSTSEADVEGYLMAQLYLTERALAATEIGSRGAQDQLVVVFDFASYLSKNSPPFSVYRDGLSAVQKIYPERLAKLLVLDAPFWMRGIYSMIYPFLSARTSDKVVMVSGSSQKETAFGDLISVDQATPVMLINGKLDSAVDIDHFLHCVPFHAIYDAVPSSSAASGEALS